MRIITRAQFLAMPAWTVYMKYEPCCFGDLMLKGETLDNGKLEHDFFCCALTDSLECEGDSDFFDTIDRATAIGESMAMEFDGYGRDGCYDPDQLFAVYEKADLEGLIAALLGALGEYDKPTETG